MANVSRIAVVLLIAVPSSFASADSITAAMRREDGRLHAKVSFDMDRITIRELVKRLATETGVDIYIGPRDGAGDVTVCAFLKDIPLWQALDGLWSLVSYKGAAWSWSRSRTETGFHYRLARPLQAQQLGERLRSWLQERFEWHAFQLTEIAEMTPQQRIENRSRIQKAFLDQRNAEIDRLISDQVLWDWIHLFGRSLSPQMKLSVLRGKSTPTIPIDHLGPRARAHIQFVWERVRRPQNPDGSATHGPAQVRFLIRNPLGGSCPVVCVEPQGMGAYGHIGYVSLEKAYRNHVTDLWALTGDATDHPLLTARLSVADAKYNNPASEAQHGLRIAHRLLEFSRLAPVSILARLPANQRKDPGSPAGQTIREFLQALSSSEVIAKWRGDLILLDSLSWPQDELALVDARYIQRLKEIARQNDGFLPLETLAEIAGSLSHPQIETLAVDFPVVMPHVNAWSALLKYCHQNPGTITAMRSTLGASIGRDLAEVLQANRALSANYDLSQSRRLRLVEQSVRDGDSVARVTSFMLVDSDGKSFGGLGFRVPHFEAKPRQPTLPSQAPEPLTPP